MEWIVYSDVFFFFQAEDGIRDRLVTGVQTCALPILTRDSAKNDSGSKSEKFRDFEKMCTIRILAMVMKFTFQQESGLKSHFGFSRFWSNFFIFATKKTLCWSSIPGTLTPGRLDRKSVV